ncbi:unnamed protein product [Periconia digitata]|uniref:Uncharacterized protein n=1 Tax=Periconia digitata TaxID=1303443 RepID=A0A9W4XVV5_9PLEO|nr:unnamed protein product [Periconia digitata]
MDNFFLFTLDRPIYHGTDFNHPPTYNLVEKPLVSKGPKQITMSQINCTNNDLVPSSTPHLSYTESSHEVETFQGSVFDIEDILARLDGRKPADGLVNPTELTVGINNHRLPIGVRRILRGNAASLPPDLALPYHPVFSTAPSPNVDLRLMGDVEITSIEMIVFFSNHYRWKDWGLRLWNAGWTFSPLVRLIFEVRKCSDEIKNMQSVLSKTTFKHLGDARGNPRSPYTTYTCKQWTPPNATNLIDYYVRDIAVGVSREDFPTGKDAGLLTQTLQHLFDHQHDPEVMELKLSGLEQFIHKMKFTKTDGEIDDKASCLSRHGCGGMMAMNGVWRTQCYLNTR